MGFELACWTTQAQRGAGAFLLWLALATNRKYLGAGSSRLARRNMLIPNNSTFPGRDMFSATSTGQECCLSAARHSTSDHELFLLYFVSEQYSYSGPQRMFHSD